MGDKPAVLVTRPEGQAFALCEALKELGFAAYSAPMLELSGLDSPNERQTEYLSRLDHYQHIIFISGNAVHFGMEWINGAWPEIPTSPIFCPCLT